MAPGPRINFGQYEFPKKVFLWNCLVYSDWTLGSCCTCDIIFIKQMASLTCIRFTKQELFSRFGSSLVTRVDNDLTWWIDKTLWMPWQGHYLVTRHLGRKKQGRQVCRRCRDAGNLRCASGMQGCTDADMQGGVFLYCFWWPSWTSVQTLLQINETSFLDAADFDVQVQHCRAIKIIFVLSIHISLPYKYQYRYIQQ